MLTVIADDFTGAAEIAGVALRYGLRVAFTLNVTVPENADVWVIATDTRSTTVQSALEKTVILASELKKAGIKKIFKKTDSVLRGHVLPELNGLISILRKKKVLLVPVNPALNRIISDGIYYVNGLPLNETSFKDDPDFPARTALVRKMLGEGVLDLHTSKVGNLKEGVTVPDAANGEDLDRLVQLVNDRIIPAGGAAFFEAYLKREFPDAVPASSCEECKVKSGNMLMVCGSTHENSKKFIAEAREKGAIVEQLPVDLMHEQIDEKTINQWALKIIGLIERDNKVIVTVSEERGSPEAIKVNMAKAIRQVIHRAKIRELYIEGGTTAFSIIREAGLKVFTPYSELKKGVVRMKAEEMDNTFVTIKPGSYLWKENILVGS